ncbi:MAG: hypothetical protein KI785_13525, partial [Devosiaceae bacterium]|nr:hypothetical protein [Devosiaceae bacterium MH13]
MTSSGPHQHLQPDDPLARRVNIAVLTTAALLVVLSTVVALHEYRVFSQALNGDFGRYIGADGAAVRLTSLSRSPGVAPCLRDLQRIEVFGACGDPEEQSRACLTALDAHLQTYPLHGEGWLQRGLLFERLGGTPD